MPSPITAMIRASLLALLLFALPREVSAAPEAEALPLTVTPSGVLFSVKAPKAKNVYVVGTFNGWGGSDGSTVTDPAVKMYGPNDEGVFELFQPLPPGTHLFKYNVGGGTDGWMSGPKNLETGKDDFDTQPGQAGVPSSRFVFALKDPPWPPQIKAPDMMPTVVTQKSTGQPFLRVRFFSRTAKSMAVVGNYDAWGGISNRQVTDPNKSMKKTNIDFVWEGYMPITPDIDTFEYKMVENKKVWMSDPSVLETSQDGNTQVKIVRANNLITTQYTPRFDPNQYRRPEEDRWGNALKWEIMRDAAYTRALAEKKKMIWVITLPGSKPSQDLMIGINTDPSIIASLKDYLCLETPAFLVRDVLEQQKIYRVPHVVLIDSGFHVVWQGFKPTKDQLKEQLARVK